MMDNHNKNFERGCSNGRPAMEHQNEVTYYGSIENTEDAEIEHNENEAKFKWQILAYFTVVLSMCLYCMSVVSVQILSGAIPEFELNGFRFLTQAVVPLPIIWCKKLSFKVQHKGLVAMIIFMFMIYNITYYGAAIYLPLGTLSGTVNSLLIAFNAIASICFVKDRSIQLYIGAIFAIIGIVLMTQPEFMFENTNLPPSPTVNWSSPCLSSKYVTSKLLNDTTIPDGEEAISMEIIFAYILVVFSAASDAIWFQCVSKTVEDLSPFVLSFWCGLIGSIISFIMMGFLETPVFPSSKMCIGLLVMHCIGTTQSATILPWCMQFLNPSVCAMVQSLYMVVLLILQYTALAGINPGLRNWLEIFGAIVCFLAVLIGPISHLLYKRSVSRNK